MLLTLLMDYLWIKRLSDPLVLHTGSGTMCSNDVFMAYIVSKTHDDKPVRIKTMNIPKNILFIVIQLKLTL